MSEVGLPDPEYPSSEPNLEFVKGSAEWPEGCGEDSARYNAAEVRIQEKPPQGDIRHLIP
jgi:hypothetical protein